MSIFNWLFGDGYKGMDGESKMTADNWKKRAMDQAMAMREGCDAFDSTPDKDGDAKGGEYNGDYRDSYHDELNKKLDEDEYYEAEAEQQTRTLWNWLEK